MKYIYTITDPRNNKVFYVGVSVNVEARAKSHMNMRNTASCRDLIEEITKSGKRPLFTVIHDKCSNWRSVEQYYIKKFLDEGCVLLNKQSSHIKKDFGFDLVIADLKKNNSMPLLNGV